MPLLPDSRLISLAVFAATAAMMAFGYYLQYVEGLEPCPLCMTQRVFLVAVGLIALSAGLLNPGPLGIRLHAGAGLIMALIGGGFSSRHIWLQSLPPDQVPACGPSIDYILDTFPLMEALEVLLRGNGNCAEITWTFIGLSIPQWTLVAFVGFAVAALLNLLRPVRH